ncbi:MAG: HyaD/HybD family hydrogenase maturation endopeptidase [Dehalococcoidales bacterium]|nr:HyaD/HybD family hydrogenase maturation endopeptidase [Dehalococcoidales bacterium]
MKIRKKTIAKNNRPRIAVIGVGNLLLKDEGIGIHVAQALEKMDLPAGVRIIDGGTSPDVLAYTGATEKLIIVDAARGGGAPGEVYRLSPADLASDSSSFSVHELGVEQSLKMMSLAGEKPKEVIIIAVEPKEIGWGTELSAELKLKLPQVVGIVLKEIGA